LLFADLIDRSFSNANLFWICDFSARTMMRDAQMVVGAGDCD
jgi:hypothetical protein